MQVIVLSLAYKVLSYVYFDLNIPIDTHVAHNHCTIPVSVCTLAGCLEGISACPVTGDDLLYSYRLALIPCRLWDEDRHEWTSDECQVRTNRPLTSIFLWWYI